MMYGYGNGMSGWGYVLMIAALLVLAALVATAVLVAVRSGSAALRPTTGVMGTQEAERILEQRFARGELDQEEFQSRMNVLRSKVKP